MMRNFIKKTGAVAMATAIVLGSSLPAFAATTNTPVAGGTTTMDKYLTMETNAHVPTATFNFTVSAGEHVNAVVGTDDASSKPEILAGVNPSAVTVQAANFTPADTDYSSVQTGDTVKLQAGEKYAKKVLTIDFSGVTFSKPGVYRYIITESASDIDGVTNDETTTRTVDVYVNSNETGALEISGYTLHRGVAVTNQTNASGGAAAHDAAEKDAGFQNKYVTSDLTLQKMVEGNQGDRSEYFKLTLDIKNATAGTIYTVEGVGTTADATVGENTNPTTITVGTGGTATADFYLQSGQSVKVLGLSPKTQYKVTETIDDSEGYKVSYQVIDGAGAIAKTDGKATPDVEIGADDDQVVITNRRNGLVPTDATTWLYLTGGLGVAALGGAVFAGKMRKKNTIQEA